MKQKICRIKNVTKSKQFAHIKIETLWGSTVPIIHTLLKEICGNATLNSSTIQQMHKRFRKRRVTTEENMWSGCPPTVTNNTSIASNTTVGTRQTLVCNGKEDRGRNCNTTNYNSLYFNFTFDQGRSFEKTSK